MLSELGRSKTTRREKEIFDKSETVMDVIKMKGMILSTCLVLMAGLGSAYTPEQQTLSDGMNLSYELGMAYDKTLQGQNVAEYNALVDEYNAFIQLHFGENTSLTKAKLDESAIQSTPTLLGSDTGYMTKQFNASSDLSKFGKQDVYVSSREPVNENAVARLQQEIFLNTM
jgi:hypothetical protein